MSKNPRVLLILEENDLLKFVNEKVPKPKVKARRILVDSIKDHLVPQVLEKKTARKMFKTMKKLFEHSSINVTLTLKN